MVTLSGNTKNLVLEQINMNWMNSVEFEVQPNPPLNVNTLLQIEADTILVGFNNQVNSSWIQLSG